MNVFKYFIILFYFSGLTFGCRHKNELPPISLLLLDSLTHITIDPNEESSATILLYFSPDCEHCQEETEGILKNIKDFKTIQFYFIANESIDRMRIFNSVYNISKYQNIVLAQDYTFSFTKYFKSAVPPYLLIYNRRKELRAILAGKSTAKEIVQYIDKIKSL